MLTGIRHRFTTIAGLLALGLMAQGKAWWYLPQGAWPYGHDALQQFKPWQEFINAARHQGLLPLWNPFVFCGASFIGNIQSRLFYPPSWLYYLVPIRVGFVIDTTLHSALTAGGVYFLCRVLAMGRPAAWLSAVLFVFSGEAVGHLALGHLPWHAARAYLPWELALLLLFLRGGDRRILGGWALCFVLQWLAGSPPMALLSVFLNLGLFVAWHWRLRGSWRTTPPRCMRLLLAAGVAAAVAAAVTLPFLELSHQALHGQGIPYEKSVGSSANWHTFVRMVTPDFFGGNQPLQWSNSDPNEENAYIGLMGLLLALGAPWFARRFSADGRRRLPAAVPWLFVLLIPAGLLALGGNLPGYHWLFDHVPLLRLNRVPARWLEVWVFAAVLLAGFSCDGIFKRQSPQRMPRLLPALTGTALATLIVVWILLARHSADDSFWTSVVPPFLTNSARVQHQVAEVFRGAAMGAMLMAVLVAAASLAIILAMIRGSQERRAFVRALWLAVLATDVVWAAWRTARVESATDVATWCEISPDILKMYDDRQRWAVGPPNFAINAGSGQQVKTVTGYDPLMPARFYEFISAVEQSPDFMFQYQPRKPSPLLRVAGVTHVVSRTAAAEPWNIGALEGSYQPWPDCYLTRDIIRTTPASQLPLLGTLANKALVTEAIPVVVDDSRIPKLASTALETGEFITLVSGGMNAKTYNVTTRAPSLLVQTDANAPGWRAWIDGRPIPVYDANYMFRAVPVPAGTSKVHLVYDSQTFRFGLFISLCALGGTFAAVCGRFFRRPATST